jgi:hypothetical protein
VSRIVTIGHISSKMQMGRWPQLRRIAIVTWINHLECQKYRVYVGKKNYGFGNTALNQNTTVSSVWVHDSLRQRVNSRFGETWPPRSPLLTLATSL